VTSTTNTPALVSKFARKVAGATSLSFDGVLSAALVVAGLAVAGLAGAGFVVAGFCVAGVVAAGLAGAGLACVGVDVAGFAVDWAQPEVADSASAAPNMTAIIAFDPTFIALLFS
jgi:hypothetical protein